MKAPLRVGLIVATSFALMATIGMLLSYHLLSFLKSKFGYVWIPETSIFLSPIAFLVICFTLSISVSFFLAGLISKALGYDIYRMRRAQNESVSYGPSIAEVKQSDLLPPLTSKTAHQRLASVKKMFDEGLITQEEYDTKKKEILSGL